VWGYLLWEYPLWEYLYWCTYSPSLTSSLEDIARHIPSLRRDIKDGLLQVLSLILTGRPPMNPGGPRLAIQSAGATRIMLYNVIYFNII